MINTIIYNYSVIQCFAIDIVAVVGGAGAGAAVIIMVVVVVVVVVIEIFLVGRR